MVKGTPKEWVDRLLEVGPLRWVPPVARYDEPSPADVLTRDHVVDWHAEWLRLRAHHVQETDVLNAVIRELVRRVKSDGDV